MRDSMRFDSPCARGIRMGQFGAGGSVFGATAAAEPGNFHVLLSHVATLELSGVPKKKRRKNGRKGRGRGARASDVWSRRGAGEPEKTCSRAHAPIARVSRRKPGA